MTQTHPPMTSLFPVEDSYCFSRSVVVRHNLHLQAVIDCSIVQLLHLPRYSCSPVYSAGPSQALAVAAKRCCYEIASSSFENGCERRSNKMLSGDLLNLPPAHFLHKWHGGFHSFVFNKYFSCFVCSKIVCGNLFSLSLVQCN